VKTQKLTKWDVGNELVKAADVLSDVASEVHQYPEAQKVVADARRKIAKLFNKKFVSTMGFGI
jgi:hypothetical protein